MSNLAKQFQSLNGLLSRYQYLWRPRAFYQDKLVWETKHKLLLNKLHSLSVEDVLSIDGNFQALAEFFNDALPEALTLWELCQLTQQNTTKDHQSLNAFDKVDIPGRKWQQITAFTNQLNRPQYPIVDWCSGKGHLARISHRIHQQPIHCLEISKQLCDEGKRLADKQQLPLTFHQHDVLKAIPDHLASSEYCHIALHACGGLHVSLLRQASLQQAKQISFSPCCYHKFCDEHYTPLSTMAKQSELHLNRTDLKLAMEETVTSGRNIRQKRQQELQWRLGYDALQRELNGQARYNPLPSIKKSLLNQDFQSFCEWACDYQQLALPNNLNVDAYLLKGKKRCHEILRKDLVRHLFRRPLEIWLVLDRALFLEEMGYQVSINEFCGREITPRNIMVNAIKSKSTTHHD